MLLAFEILYLSMSLLQVAVLSLGRVLDIVNW